MLLATSKSFRPCGYGDVALGRVWKSCWDTKQDQSDGVCTDYFICGETVNPHQRRLVRERRCAEKTDQTATDMPWRYVHAQLGVCDMTCSYNIDRRW